MSGTRKALFVPFAPSLAHVSRCLAVAEAWRAKGHIALFATGRERKKMVEEAGFDAYPLPETPGDVFRTDRGFRWLTADYFNRNLQAERDVLAQTEPDVIVFDFRFTTSSAASLAGLPSVSIVHGNALRLALHPHETAGLLVGEPGHSWGAAALRLRVLRCVFPVVFRAFQRTAARRFGPVLKAHGLPPVHSPFELLLGDELLLADIPALLPPDLPSHSHLVGALTWQGWDQPAPWLDELDDRPLIYVTMGSTVEAQQGLVKIIGALREAPYNVVVSTSSLILPSGLELPGHIRVFPTVPGASVVRRSAAVVHHGGHETLLQALSAGVPSLIIPANPDQVLIARQAQALGIAHSLWHSGGLPLGDRILQEMTQDQIRRRIDDLLADETCRRACREIQEEVEASGGAAAAVDVLEGIAETSEHTRDFSASAI